MTQPDRQRFADLAPRLISGLGIAALGVGAIWAGGAFFAALVLAVLAAAVWELGHMLAPGTPRNFAVALGLGTAALVVGATLWLPPLAALAAILLPIVLVPLWFRKLRSEGTAYLALVLLGGHAFLVLRAEFGLVWTLWLALLVIGSDVAGYFAGRFIGGPKLWPRVSPKKTWSGTAAGWVLGLLIGAAFLPLLGGGAGLLALSLAVVVAGQAGDIAESALKRRAGTKDSSDLIPGHGGVLDRFDAMMGAAVLFLLAARLGLGAAGA